MLDIQVIDDPAAATVALEPVRSRLLSELVAPASAATLATRVGLARQKVKGDWWSWRTLCSRNPIPRSHYEREERTLWTPFRPG
jgi:hypothetical protein